MFQNVAQLVNVILYRPTIVIQEVLEGIVLENFCK